MMKRPPPLPKSLEQLIPKLLKPMIKKQGFHHARLILDWEKIVGTHLAGICKPKQVLFHGYSKESTLLLEVLPHASLIVQYAQPQILEKVNRFLGFKGISHLRFKQSYFCKKPLEEPHISSYSLSESDKEQVRNMLHSIQDTNLHDALEKLALAIKHHSHQISS